MKKTSDQTKINTSLPYCLDKVDSRFFYLNDNFNTKIRFTKVETFPNRRTHDASNFETIRDRWGIDAHSDVLIITEKKFDDQDSDEAENFVLKIINDFVRLYRFHDKRAVHLVDLSREDLFGFSCLRNGRGFFQPV